MLVKVIKIVYLAIDGPNFDFSYYCTENTQVIHLTTNTRPLRKRLTRNLVKKFKEEQSEYSLLSTTWDINNKTIKEMLLNLDWINDAVEILSYEI